MSERLKEIINDLPYSIRHEGSVEALIEYAKEQAERVEELGKVVDKQSQVILRQDSELDVMEQQNKRYREALLSIANEDVYVATATQIALEALEDEDK